MLKINHFLGDGKYANNTVLKLCKKYDLFLISKLQNNSALFFEYIGEYSGKGKHKIYGYKLDYKEIPPKYLINKVLTKTYQMKLLSKSMNGRLNMVIVHKTIDKKLAHAVFFSNDLTLSFQKIIDYYSLRFQIEFNFRDAKQF